MTIVARELKGVSDIPLRKLPVRVKSILRPDKTVAILTLQLPTTDVLLFKAGQYVDLILKDGKRRSFSMANPPHLGNELVLHIRYNAKGSVSRLLFPELESDDATPVRPIQERDILRVEGPFGTFFLREESDLPVDKFTDPSALKSTDKPTILLASGTGFAPIHSVIEHIIFQKIKRPITLYWGGRRPADLYLMNECLAWEKNLAHFKFVPVISDPQPDDNWQGRTGFVHHAVMSDFPDLSQHEVYACGVPIMVNSARRDLIAKNKLPADAFYADSFEAAPQPNAT